MAQAKSKAAKSTAVATKQNSQVASVPDFMKGAETVKSNLDSDDIELPRMKLLQSLSPELEDGHKAGDLFHHVMEHSFGSSVRVVPIFHFKSYMLWNPRKSGGGILARADDGVTWNRLGEWEVTLDSNKQKRTWAITDRNVRASGLAEWGTSDDQDENSPPAATKLINVVAWLPDFPEMSPIVIPFQRGLLKSGTRWVSKIEMSQAPEFGQVFELSTEKVPNNDGEEYFSFKTRGDGFLKDEDLFEKLGSMHRRFAEMTISVVDAEGMAGDGTTSDSTSEDEEISSRI